MELQIAKKIKVKYEPHEFNSKDDTIKWYKFDVLEGDEILLSTVVTESLIQDERAIIQYVRDNVVCIPYSCIYNFVCFDIQREINKEDGKINDITEKYIHYLVSVNGLEDGNFDFDIKKMEDDKLEFYKFVVSNETLKQQEYITAPFLKTYLTRQNLKGVYPISLLNITKDEN
jgi:hypothetical protein